MPARNVTKIPGAIESAPTRSALPLLLISGLLSLSGCGASTRSFEGRSFDENDSSQVALALGNRDSLDALISKHKGQVVLVDYWATWCSACQKQFPHTVALHAAYAPDGLQVITVSLDEPEDQDSVLEFLQISRADFVNLISDQGGSMQSVTEFGIEAGAIPYVQLYDKWGELRHTSNDMYGIEMKIEQLLAETARPAPRPTDDPTKPPAWNPYQTLLEQTNDSDEIPELDDESDRRPDL